MEIEIRLKALLQACTPSQDDHGVFRRIETAMGVNRRTVSRLYHNQMKNPPLSDIGLIADFLAQHGVPAESLPQALFGVRPSKLWEAIGEKEMVTLYLGEYQRTDGPMPARLSISRRDASVAAEMIDRLSALSSAGEGRRPKLHIEYVPFQFGFQSEDVSDVQFARDVAGAKRIFEQMRFSAAKKASIMIGSQRVNYCTELFVADQFGCPAFADAGGEARVPFYIVYRDFDRKVRSCFGGTNLPGASSQQPPGIYYRKRPGAAHWERWEWKLASQDGGIVIAAYDKRTGAIELALLGFSGRATANIGTHFLHNPHLFWPPKGEAGGRQVGVYVCQITYSEVRDGDRPPETGRIEAVPLSAATVRHYLA